MLQKCFGTLPHICNSTQSCLGALWTIPSTLWNVFFLLRIALSTVGPYIDRCVPFQIMSNQFKLQQVDSNQVVETSQGWSMETGFTWDFKLGSGESCFHWSSLMFLQLDWSPPVVNSIDWTWFGKAHTCLYKVPQLTVHVKAKTKPWGRRNCP